MTLTHLARALILIAALTGASFLLSFAPHAAAARISTQQSASASPTPSPSPSPSVDARGKVIGLVYLTAFGAGGFLLSRWIRRKRPPRPPGPLGLRR